MMKNTQKRYHVQLKMGRGATIPCLRLSAFPNEINSFVGCEVQRQTVTKLLSVACALKGLDDGQFRLSRLYHQPIVVERLQALTYAEMCIDCQLVSDPSMPSRFTHRGRDYQQLEELTPNVRVPGTHICLDYGNLRVRLRKRDRISDNPQTVIKAVEAAIADLWDIIAYVDCSWFFKVIRHNILLTPALMDVETKYQVHMRGKIPILALRDGLSRELQRVADGARYVDQYVYVLQQTQHDSTRLPRVSDKPAEPAMRSNSWLHSQGLRLAYVNQVVTAADQRLTRVGRLWWSIDFEALVQCQRAVPHGNDQQGQTEIQGPNPNGSSRTPAYSPDRFVDREEEIGLVTDKVHLLAENRPVDRRTTIFIGARGVGKSWFLAHLQEELHRLPTTALFLLNLEKYAGCDPFLAVTDVLERIGALVAGQHGELGTTPAGLSRNLVQDIRLALGQQVLVLLIDHVYEADWRLLATLEDYMLGPLAEEPRVLIVMAGRGRAYPWKTPELRLKAEFVDLEPFLDVSITKEQLKRQQKATVPRAEGIHELSGGNPLFNYLLAVHDDPIIALDQVIEGMLEVVPTPQRLRVRNYLEALCVLRSFDEERIPTMLAAYHNDESCREWSYTQARQVRQELVKRSFARWNAEQTGYVLEEPMRKLLEHYLRIARPDRWRRLHQEASKLYQEWAWSYPHAGDRWQREAEHHDIDCKLPTPTCHPSPFDSDDKKDLLCRKEASIFPVTITPATGPRSNWWYIWASRWSTLATRFLAHFIRTLSASLVSISLAGLARFCKMGLDSLKPRCPDVLD
jgi:hypothetical protein